MPVEEPLLFLDSMEQDLSVSRYRTFADLRGYMRGSASAVGLMMLAVMEAELSERTIGGAKAMGEAMQLTNFLRDVGEDARRGRIYLPLEDLDSFGVPEDEILTARCSPGFVRLMQFEIERARSLYRLADDGIERLPRHAQWPVRLASALYARILDRIERHNYDVFRARARTSPIEKVMVAARLWRVGV
jgi:phytoene synthase